MKKSILMTTLLVATSVFASTAVMADPQHNHGKHSNNQSWQQPHYTYKNQTKNQHHDKQHKNDDKRYNTRYGQHDKYRQPYLTQTQYRQLPPGLQKNVNRGKALPPAWANKLNASYYSAVPYNGGYRYVLNNDIYRNARIVNRPSNGVVRINTNNRLIDVIEASRVILNVL